MIDLYSAPTLNGMRAKIMLDECALPYRLYRIDTAKGDNKTAAFLALNPSGHVPVIVDTDGPGGAPVTLTHSVSILIYLADKTKRFVPDVAAQRLQVLDALSNIAIDLGQTLDAMIVLSRTGDIAAQCQSPFEARFRSYLNVWDAKLQQQSYCAGENISIADFALVSIYARGRQLNPGLLSALPAIERWAHEMLARPGVQKGMDFS